MVMRKQRYQGKLFPLAEGPFEFVDYGNRKGTTAVLRDALEKEIRPYISLLRPVEEA